VRRIALLSLVVAATAAIAGCGTSQSDVVNPPQLISAGQVMQKFKQAPGQPKLRQAPPDDAWEQLSLGLDVPDELRARYGVFNVYVVKASRPNAVSSLLRDKATRKALKADDFGVYWEYDDLSSSYVAYKRYGANVVLAWWSEKKTPSTDERFDRLDSILSGLPG
jgi:hypothetical protein